LSDFPWGSSWSEGKLLYFYFKLITYKIPSTYLFDWIKYKVEINSNNEVDFTIEDNFINNQNDVLKSAILDCFDFNLHEALKRKTTPYVFSGLSYFIYDELFVLNGETRKDYSEGSLAIPMVVGIKSNLIQNFVIGVEVGARYTFTDNLDGSNPKNENLATLKFGNINSNDWYFFSGITITYTFGEKPCYCAE
jgi:hypothetical protein